MTDDRRRPADHGPDRGTGKTGIGWASSETGAGKPGTSMTGTGPHSSATSATSTGSASTGPASTSSGTPVSISPAATSPGWKGTGRELAVAAVLGLALTAAAWVLDGPTAAGFVLLICVTLALVGLRALIELDEEPPRPPESHEFGPSQSYIGFWRTRSDLFDATRSLSAWDHELRPRLTNLLAARLSERHGISLADDPDAARDLLNAGRHHRHDRRDQPGRHDLWTWIDPQRPTPPDAGSKAGIPPNVLAALIDRLEKL